MEAVQDYTVRADYRPGAQPPDKHGVIAHTPDPTKYLQDGYRTIIPRAVPGEDRGASQGFVVQPGEVTIVNLDPTDPTAAARSGFKVDLGKATKEQLDKAAQYSADPLRALEELSRQVAATAPPVPPVQGPPVMSSLPTAAPPLQLAPPPYVNGSPPACPALPASAGDPLTALAEVLKHLQPAIGIDPQTLLVAPRQPTAPAPVGDYSAIGMPFLGLQPQPPTVPVIFHFPVGSFRALYHHVTRRGLCLALVYDNRWNGEQFVPQAQKDESGQQAAIQLETLGQTLNVLIPDFHSTIGCLDILNLLVDPGPEEQAAAQQSLHGHGDLLG